MYFIFLLCVLKLTLLLVIFINTFNWISGDVLEIGVQYSIATKDIPSFERYMAQLKCYYLDYKSWVLIFTILLLLVSRIGFGFLYYVFFVFLFNIAEASLNHLLSIHCLASIFCSYCHKIGLLSSTLSLNCFLQITSRMIHISDIPYHWNSILWKALTIKWVTLFPFLRKFFAINIMKFMV